MRDNNITLTGNLTADPELRYTASGKAVCNISVAHNNRYTTSSGDAVERVTFIDVDVWGSLGENAAASLAKGNRVTLTGNLSQQSWETDTGDTRRRHVINATDVAASLRFATANITTTRNDQPTDDQPDELTGEEPF